MGCSDSAVQSNDNNNPNYNNNNIYHYSYTNNPNFINNNVDTDDFNEGDFPHFQPNYYDKNIKNIKKVYEERINEGNNIKVKIHKILILINYVERNTTTIQIEIEKLDGRTINKHLTELFYNECSLDNVRTLIEKYNSLFKIDSRQWYKSKSSSDIYIKAEKINNKLFKIIKMFYEKDISRLTFNKIIKCGNSENSSEVIYSNITPWEIVRKYNELKSIYYDNNPEIFDFSEEPKESVHNNYSKKQNYSNNNYYSNNNNYSYKKNYSNDNNYSNHERNSSNNNESEEKNSDRSATMKNRDGLEIGRVDRNGRIQNRDGLEIGRFVNGGDIQDRSGLQVARIVNGRIENRDGLEMGRVENGVVKNRDGLEVGRIESDGTVKNRDGIEIGNAGGMSDEQAAYLYFFKD